MKVWTSTMSKKLFICIMFVAALLLIYVMFTFKFNIQPVEVHGKIFIRSDGSVVPSTAPIKREGDVYVFTDDIINNSIVVERSNVEIDGAGHKLQGLGFLNGTGFDLKNVKGVTIKRVKISEFYWGVHMYLCSYCMLLENEMSNNAYGIFVSWSNNSIITGNQVMNNKGGGIYLASSLNFSVEKNTVTFNSYYGVRLASSHNCTVVENSVANNKGTCIYLVLSNNNIIHHNNFVNNTKAYADEKAYSNVWDEGYPSGGNYWSDYTGVDVKSGPYQNEADNDGIGDTPYIIDENNTDHYPLMNPYWLPGDVNHDLKIDIYDVVRITGVYGSEQGDLNWNPHSDIAEPYGIINIYDVVTCTKDYRKEYAP